MLSETVRADASEGDIGMQLDEIATQKLAQAKRAVDDVLERVRRAQSNSA